MRSDEPSPAANAAGFLAEDAENAVAGVLGEEWFLVCCFRRAGARFAAAIIFPWLWIVMAE